MSATKEYYFDILTAEEEGMEEDYAYQEYLRDKEREDRAETARILADRFGMNNEDWEV